MTEVRSKSNRKEPKGGEKGEVDRQIGKLSRVARLKKGVMGVEGEGNTNTWWHKLVAS